MRWFFSPKKDLQSILNPLAAAHRASGRSACGVTIEDCEHLIAAHEWEVAVELLSELYIQMKDEGVCIDRSVEESLIWVAQKLSMPSPFAPPATPAEGPSYEQMLPELRRLSQHMNPAQMADHLKSENVSPVPAIRLLRELYNMSLNEAMEVWS